MQRILLSAALCLAALSLTSTARAHHGGVVRVSGNRSLVRSSSYPTRSVQLSKSGPIRSGSRTWCSRSCWCPRYGCYGYYNPTCCSWYYWYPAQSCYYPFTYINQYPPTPATAQVVVQPIGPVGPDGPPAGPDGPPVGPGGPPVGPSGPPVGPGGPPPGPSIPPIDPGSPPPVPEPPQ